MSLLVGFCRFFGVEQEIRPLVASRGSAPNGGTGSRCWPWGTPPVGGPGPTRRLDPICLKKASKTRPWGGPGGAPGGPRGGLCGAQGASGGVRGPLPGGHFWGVRTRWGQNQAKSSLTVVYRGGRGAPAEERSVGSVLGGSFRSRWSAFLGLLRGGWGGRAATRGPPGGYPPGRGPRPPPPAPGGPHGPPPGPPPRPAQRPR
jgi:translation initiation factor IF-2